MTVYNSISLMLPSRGRVANGWLPRCLESAYARADYPARVRPLVLVDRDDPATAEYVLRQQNARVVWNNAKDGPHLARFYNALYAAQTEEASAVSMVGDDMEFRTRGWDTMVLDELNRYRGFAVVHGDDDYRQHGRMAVHLFTTRRLVQATGRAFMWERWRANIIDFVWTEVARLAGVLHYLPEMHIAHHHSGQHQDETYRRMTPYRQFASGKHSGLITAYVMNAAEDLRKAVALERD